jgi:hypothetical protein
VVAVAALISVAAAAADLISVVAAADLISGAAGAVPISRAAGAARISAVAADLILVEAGPTLVEAEVPAHVLGARTSPVLVVVVVAEGRTSAAGG